MPRVFGFSFAKRLAMPSSPKTHRTPTGSNVSSFTKPSHTFALDQVDMNITNSNAIQNETIKKLNVSCTQSVNAPKPQRRFVVSNTFDLTAELENLKINATTQSTHFADSDRVLSPTSNLKINTTTPSFQVQVPTPSAFENQTRRYSTKGSPSLHITNPNNFQSTAVSQIQIQTQTQRQHQFWSTWNQLASTTSQSQQQHTNQSTSALNPQDVPEFNAHLGFDGKLTPLPGKVVSRANRLSRKFGADRILNITYSTRLPRSISRHRLTQRLRHWAIGDKEIVGDRTYRMLTGSVKGTKGELIMFAESGTGLETVSVEDVLEWHIPSNENPKMSAYKLHARLKLAMTDSIAVDIPENVNVVCVPDIAAYADSKGPNTNLSDPRTDSNDSVARVGDRMIELSISSEIMTDGCGLVDHGTMAYIQEKLMQSEDKALQVVDGRSICVVQCRLGPHKGLLLSVPHEYVNGANSNSVNWQNINNGDNISDSNNKIDNISHSNHNSSSTIHNNSRNNNTNSNSSFSSTIAVRPSMTKYSLPNPDLFQRQLEVKSIGASQSGALNKQIIVLLVALGVPTRHLIDIQNDTHQRIQRMICHDVHAVKSFVDSNSASLGANSDTVLQMVEHGLGADFFAMRNLAAMAIKEVKSMRESVKIPLSQARRLIIVPDPTGTLRPGEVCVRYSGVAGGKVEGQDVLMARNPCHKLSDVIKAKAVALGNEWEYLHDVCVVSTQGKLSDATRMSGGDFDGDYAWVCWDARIVEYASSVETPDEYIKRERELLFKKEKEKENQTQFQSRRERGVVKQRSQHVVGQSARRLPTTSTDQYQSTRTNMTPRMPRISDVRTEETVTNSGNGYICRNERSDAVVAEPKSRINLVRQVFFLDSSKTATTSLGYVTNLHLRWADMYGADCEECGELAELCAVAVDAGKTGKTISVSSKLKNIGDPWWWSGGGTASTKTARSITQQSEQSEFTCEDELCEASIPLSTIGQLVRRGDEINDWLMIELGEKAGKQAGFKRTRQGLVSVDMHGNVNEGVVAGTCESDGAYVHPLLVRGWSVLYPGHVAHLESARTSLKQFNLALMQLIEAREGTGAMRDLFRAHAEVFDCLCGEGGADTRIEMALAYYRVAYEGSRKPRQLPWVLENCAWELCRVGRMAVDGESS